MLNKIFLIGNLGRNPLIEVTQTGKQIAKFSLATSSEWRDGTSVWHEHTDWHQVVVFKETTARWIKDTFKKGDRVYVEGKLTYRSWKNKRGDNHRSTQILVSGNNGQVIHFPRHPLPEAIDLSGFDTISEGFIPENLPSLSFNSESLDSEELTPEILESKDLDYEDFCPEDLNYEDLDPEDLNPAEDCHAKPYEQDIDYHQSNQHLQQN